MWRNNWTGGRSFLWLELSVIVKERVSISACGFDILCYGRMYVRGRELSRSTWVSRPSQEYPTYCTVGEMFPPRPLPPLVALSACQTLYIVNSLMLVQSFLQKKPVRRLGYITPSLFVDYPLRNWNNQAVETLNNSGHGSIAFYFLLNVNGQAIMQNSYIFIFQL